MKLKQQFDDFQVEELTDLTGGHAGPFAVYRLEKRGWTSPDAVQVLCRRWKLDVRRVGYGGLKDRHAVTVQYLTIHLGPRRDFRHHEIQVRYLGQVAEPYESRHIRGNRFRIVLRHLQPADIENAMMALEETRRDGLPNYFDDQRFGSVRGHGTFMAEQLVHGRFEEALRTALTAPYEFDRAEQKRAKRMLLDHWGDWAICLERLPRGHTRDLLEYLLHHPGDFRGALVGLQPELRGLYLAAYQSFLWNRILARWLATHCRAEQLMPVELRLGPVPFPRGLDEATRATLANLSLPLPSARLRLEPTDPMLALIQQVLVEEGLELRTLQVKGIREMFFSKGERAAHVMPDNLEYETGDDELNRGRHTLTLAFDLPRGAYATLLVKRVTGT